MTVREGDQRRGGGLLSCPLFCQCEPLLLDPPKPPRACRSSLPLLCPHTAFVIPLPLSPVIYAVFAVQLFAITSPDIQ